MSTYAYLFVLLVRLSTPSRGAPANASITVPSSCWSVGGIHLQLMSCKPAGRAIIA